MKKTPYKKNLEPRHFDEMFREIQQDILYYNIVEVSLSTTATSVEHKLDAVPNGFLVIGKDANADVWESAVSDKRFLYLISDTTVNVKLYIF